MERQRVVAVTGADALITLSLVLSSARVTGPEGSPVTLFQPGREPVFQGRAVWVQELPDNDQSIIGVIIAFLLEIDTDNSALVVEEFTRSPASRSPTE
ncbi:hypothetical protein [Herbidospora daliensis]|uniref:hypothetical protein n=1 Tax=Herbidospora daliensis TaxID=295585 RepID=UPI0007812B96|nr:hypothetical protein [Herbidospora daliensis]